MKSFLILFSICLNRSLGNRFLHNKREYHNFGVKDSLIKDISNDFIPKNYLTYNKVRNLIVNFDEIDTYTGLKSNVKSVEHIWPQSFYKQSKQKNKIDMHLLTQIDLKTNIFRSNYKFIDSNLLEFNSIRENTISLKENEDMRKNINDRIFYLPDRAKGTVSRSIAYSALIYPELMDNLNYVINKNDLISWCLNYPVTEEERLKNDFIWEYQGNLNPFVVDPELILFFKDT